MSLDDVIFTGAVATDSFAAAALGAWAGAAALFEAVPCPGVRLGKGGDAAVENCVSRQQERIARVWFRMGPGGCPVFPD
jgi:hypothetical protein